VGRPSAAAAPPDGSPRVRRRTLWLACGFHFLHDGLTDALYLIFPPAAAALGLSLAQVGLLKGAYNGVFSLAQVPVSVMAERVGAVVLLGLGTGALGLGFGLLGAAPTFAALLLTLTLGALGASTQHPLGAALVARAFEGEGRRMSLGTYNFAGDVGKAGLTAAAGLVAGRLGWREMTRVIGGTVLALAGPLALALQRIAPGRGAQASPSARGERGRWREVASPRFGVLAAVAILDNSTRTGVLTYLPFLLVAKELAVEQTGLALSLLFAGGATGKFLCGALAEWAGIVPMVILTEVMTSGLILGLLVAPGPWLLVIMPLVGLALNGTSSVLYATVADLVGPAARGRAYGLFYSVTTASGAVGPAIYGLVADAAGLTAVMWTLALAVLATVPLALALRGRGENYES
jgi:MFS family permease